MKTIRDLINGLNTYLAEHNGKEPDAVICSVKFYDDEEDMEVLIKLNCEVENPFDYDFFFYCKHLNGLFSILGEDSNLEDFYVNRVYEFVDSKEYLA